MREPIQLGTFTARSAELDRKYAATKAKRDRQFHAHMTVLLLMIFGLCYFGIPYLVAHYAKQARISQETYQLHQAEKQEIARAV